MRDALAPHIEAGRIRAIDSRYSLAEARAAHDRMRASQHFGKILLIP